MLTDVSEVRTASIIRAIIIGIYLTTRQYIPEDSKLHTHCRENPKSHKFSIYLPVYSFTNLIFQNITGTYKVTVVTNCKFVTAVMMKESRTKVP
jgi:hypothetical protein